MLKFAQLLFASGQITPNEIDGSTYGNIDEINSTHLHLNFAVDFSKEVFKGWVKHSMTCLKTGTTRVLFDYVGMTIDSSAQVCTQMECY
jgi:hypothetical protein